MGELPREFYRLDELAERRNRTASDILQLAVTGNLDLSIFYHGNIYYLITVNPGGTKKTSNAPSGIQDVYVRVKKSDLRLLLSKRDFREWSVSSKEFVWEDGKTMCGDRVTEISTSTIVVMFDELERAEAQYPELFKHAGQQYEKPVTQQHDKPNGRFKTSGYRTGDEELCAAFGVGPNSISTVRKRVKVAGVKFDYDPKTQEKRLLLSVINEILAGEEK